MNILFMGTPDIAAACLQALLDAGHHIVGAVCQPDRPRGRGHKLMPPPVKVLAEQNGIPVFQPEILKNGAFDATVKELEPQLNVVVAYGKILPASVLFAPPYGSINVHASLLPKYRGAAPMQRVLMDGETETGVTIMYMDEGLDTGDMIIKETIPLTGAEDFEWLHDKTAAVGGELLCRAVELITEGKAPREKQPESGFTYAAKIENQDCMLDFARPAVELERQIRALCPMPLALTHLPDGRKLKVMRARVGDIQRTYTAEEIGRVIAMSSKSTGSISVACGQGVLELLDVRPEGKGGMCASAFICGRSISLGDRLKSHE